MADGRHGSRATHHTLGPGEAGRRLPAAMAPLRCHASGGDVRRDNRRRLRLRLHMLAVAKFGQQEHRETCRRGEPLFGRIAGPLLLKLKRHVIYTATVFAIGSQQWKCY